MMIEICPSRVCVSKDAFMCWAFNDQKDFKIMLEETYRIVSVKNVHAMRKWSNTLTYGIKVI